MTNQEKLEFVTSLIRDGILRPTGKNVAGEWVFDLSHAAEIKKLFDDVERVEQAVAHFNAVVREGSVH